jgi:hypothetical protein
MKEAKNSHKKYQNFKPLQLIHRSVKKQLGSINMVIKQASKRSETMKAKSCRGKEHKRKIIQI